MEIVLLARRFFFTPRFFCLGATPQVIWTLCLTARFVFGKRRAAGVTWALPICHIWHASMRRNDPLALVTCEAQWRVGGRNSSFGKTSARTTRLRSMTNQTNKAGCCLGWEEILQRDDHLRSQQWLHVFPENGTTRVRVVRTTLPFANGSALFDVVGRWRFKRIFPCDIAGIVTTRAPISIRSPPPPYPCFWLRHRRRFCRTRICWHGDDAPGVFSRGA